MLHFSFNTSLLALIALAAAARADITATWNGTTGNWTDSARWSGGVFPNNSGPNFYDVTINAGTVTLNQGIAINQLALGGGTVAGASPLTLAEGVQWGGDATLALGGAGSITLGAGSASVVTGAAIFASGTIFGGGNATLSVQPGATFTVLDGANFFAQVSSPAWTLTNAGTLIARNTGGGGFTTLDAALAGAGALRVENTGASHTLSLAGGGTLGGSVHLDANTTLELGGTLTIAAGTTFTGAGAVVSAGTVTLGGSIAVPRLSAPIGELRLAGYTLAVTGAALVDDNATLVAELHGTGAAQVSKLAVSGALELYGTLRVTLGGGFTPAVGNTFDILDFASVTGAFTSVQLPAPPANTFWRTDRLYTDGKISLSTVPPTFAQWQAAFGVGAFTTDDDGDSIGNGIEFALGINPTTGTGVNGPLSLPRASIAANRVRLQFDMPDPGATDVTLRVEASDDFGRTDPWVAIATKVGAGAWSGSVTITPIAGGRVTVTVVDTKFVNVTSKRFLRLAVTLP